MIQFCIPMSSPDITAAEIEVVHQVLQTPYLSMGPMIDRFEEAMRQYIGAKHAVAVSSGTAGLHLCVRAAGITDGDLVLTTPFSFIASANCILYERGIPIFVDIDPHTLNIEPSLVGEAVHDLSRGGPAAQHWLLRNVQRAGVQRVNAILPVHVFGQPADMDPILDVARRYELTVIEDACEAIGAEYRGRRIGVQRSNVQLATVFAFYPNKQMTTGEGGMIVTDRDDWDALFCSLRNQGRDVFDAWLNHSRLGYNYRLDEMSAALGLAQLGRIEELLAKRERVAAWYNERLSDVELIAMPYITPTTTRMSWFVYVIRMAPEISCNAVMAALGERGIPSRPYFTPIHLQSFYREAFGYQEGDFPVTERVARSTLALPFYGNMSEQQVDYVSTSLREAIQRVTCAHLGAR